MLLCRSTLMFVAIHSSSLSPLCFLHLPTSSTRISTCYLFYVILARQPLFKKLLLVTPFHAIPTCRTLLRNSQLSPRTCCGVCLVMRYLLKKPELATLLDGPRNKCGVTSEECGVTSGECWATSGECVATNQE